MKSIKSKIIIINNFLAELSGWLLVIIMALLMVDFMSRGLSMPIQGINELAVFSLVSVVYLGSAHTELIKGNVRVTAITSRLPSKIEAFFEIVVEILGLLTVLILFKASIDSAVKSYVSHESVAGTVPLPMWPVNCIIVFSLFFYVVQILINIIDDMSKLKAKC